MKRHIKSVQPLFLTFTYAFLTAISVICLLPFVMLVSGSFTDEQSILRNGYALWPGEFSVSAYQMLFRFPQDIIQSYGVSIFITVVGTLVGLFLISMTAYVTGR
jgi:putative aldouronate transport system permease protein